MGIIFEYPMPSVMALMVSVATLPSSDDHKVSTSEVMSAFRTLSPPCVPKKHIMLNLYFFHF